MMTGHGLPWCSSSPSPATSECAIRPRPARWIGQGAITSSSCDPAGDQFGRKTHGLWARVRNKSRDFDHSMSQLGTAIRGPSGRSRMRRGFFERGIKASTLVLIFILRRQNASVCRGDRLDSVPSGGRSLASMKSEPWLVGTDETPYSGGPNVELSRIPMRTLRRMKTKLVLVGESGVGKTSLIRRFMLNEYEDAYVPTVGTKVSRIELTVPHGADMDVQMDMAIFDITGQKGVRDLGR